MCTPETSKYRITTYAEITKKNIDPQSSEFLHSNTTSYITKSNTLKKKYINQNEKQIIDSIKISSCPIHNNSSGTTNNNIDKSYNNKTIQKNNKLRTSTNELHTVTIQTKNNNIRTDQSFISKPNSNLKSNTNNNITYDGNQNQLLLNKQIMTTKHIFVVPISNSRFTNHSSNDYTHTRTK